MSLRIVRPHPVLFRWLLIALIFRGVCAWTHRHWNYPDEWYQTLELAHLLGQGSATWTQEIILHLRNLTWPMTLSLPVTLAYVWAPDSPHLRIFFAQLFCGVLDLGLLWGWWQMIRAWTREHPAFESWQEVALASAVLPWFFIQDSVVLSLEHASSILFWMLLGCVASKRYRWAGFLAVGVFALRYPSGLLSIGVFLGFLIEAWRTRQRQGLIRFMLGALIGGVIFGLPDAIFYGRPWESLWMYFQYNVWSGLGGDNYGRQSWLTYLDYFCPQWPGLLWPFLALAMLGGAWGIFQRFRLSTWAEPWLLALMLYGVGHLCIAHKEARFIAPLELLFFWAAWEGWTHLAQISWKGSRLAGLGLRFILVATFLVNAYFSLPVFWGDLGSVYGQYFQVSGLLEAHPRVCAVISVLQPHTILYPNVPIGDLDLRSNPPNLTWAEVAPSCDPKQEILLLAYEANPYWAAQGCRFEREGAPFSVSPTTSRGAWYFCPTSLLSVFTAQEVEHPVVKTFPSVLALPGLKNSGEWLRNRTEEDLRARGGCTQLCHVRF